MALWKITSNVILMDLLQDAMPCVKSLTCISALGQLGSNQSVGLIVMMELLKLEQEALAKAAATNNSGDGTPGAQ